MGGVVDALLSDPTERYKVRAITRDPSSDKARSLAGRGVEIVQADFADSTSTQQALDGADSAFLVTNFWAHGSAERESLEIAHLVSAAQKADLRHVVWSTLEDTRLLLPLSDPRMPVLQERYNVPHFDAKGEGNLSFEAAGVPTTYLNTTFFYQGFLQGSGPKRQADGSLVLSLPFEAGKRLAGVDVKDVGRTAAALFSAGTEYIGKTVSLAGDHLTGDEYASLIADAVGEPVTFQSVPYDAFRALGLPAGDEIANMFQYYGDFETEFTDARNLEDLKALNPALKSFETWSSENAAALKSAL